MCINKCFIRGPFWRVPLWNTVNEWLPLLLKGLRARDLGSWSLSFNIATTISHYPDGSWGLGCSSGMLMELNVFSFLCWRDAAFLLTIGSFLLTIEFPCLHLCFLTFLLSIGAFFIYSWSFFFCIQLDLCCFQLENVCLRSTPTDCKQRNSTVSKQKLKL